jgi:hypothetical protein
VSPGDWPLPEVFSICFQSIMDRTRVQAKSDAISPEGGRQRTGIVGLKEPLQMWAA